MSERKPRRDWTDNDEDVRDAIEHMDAALDTLDKAGFTDVSLTGWKPMSCSEEDFSSTGFAAVNSQGKPVEGVVCCGLFLKSCTVRF